MPIHDWTRVSAGTFHHFHLQWIAQISNALNAGLLPPSYYAMAEQVIEGAVPDVLTLQVRPPGGNGSATEADHGPVEGTTAVATAPPRVRITASVASDLYAARQRSVVVRDREEDRIVALIEIVSAGNKSSVAALRTFVDKAAEALEKGYHLLLVDLQPPTVRDPSGIHGAIWRALAGDDFVPPADKPLTLAAYSAGPSTTTAYVEPVAVGDPLPPMPLFLNFRSYVEVPLEATYVAALRGMPTRWRSVLEG